MNSKDGFNFNEILWSFLDQSKDGAKNYERDHPLPSFSCSERVIIASKMEK